MRVSISKLRQIIKEELVHALKEGNKASKTVGDPPYREQGATESQAQQKAAGMALSARRGDTAVSKLKGAALELYNGEITTKEAEQIRNDVKNYTAISGDVQKLFEDENGDKHSDTFEGLMCRVFQHEMDHMDGIDFTSRAKRMDLNIAKRKMKRGKLKLKRAHGKDMLAQAS